MPESRHLTVPRFKRLLTELDVKNQANKLYSDEILTVDGIEIGRGEWVRPELTRLSAGSAEQGVGGIGSDFTGSAS